MTTVLPLGSRHGAGFVWSAPGHARASPPASPHVMPPASRAAQRSPSVNFTGNRTLCRKNRRPSDFGTGCSTWLIRARWSAFGFVIGRPPHRRSAPPAQSRPSTNTERSSAALQNRLSPGDSGLIGLDVQRSEVASRPGNGRVRPVVIADIDHDRDGPASPCRDLLFGGGWPCSDLSRASRGSRLAGLRVWLSARAKLRPQTVRFQYSIRRRFLRTRYQSR